jgi:hypothetical protein
MHSLVLCLAHDRGACWTLDVSIVLEAHLGDIGILVEVLCMVDALIMLQIDVHVDVHG